MGRVRPNIVKKAARSIVEKYYGRCVFPSHPRPWPPHARDFILLYLCWMPFLSLTFDFDSNKKVTEEIAVLPSKRIRNKISGYVTVPHRACFLNLLDIIINYILSLSGRPYCISPCLILPPPDCLVTVTALDEAHPARPRPRHLPEVAGGGARAPLGLYPREGVLCFRSVCFEFGMNPPLSFACWFCIRMYVHIFWLRNLVCA
jgi:ribosomal protein S17E